MSDAFRGPDAGLAFLRQLIVAGNDGQSAIEAMVMQRMRDLDCVVEEVIYDPRSVPLVDEFAAASSEPASRSKYIVGRIGKPGTGRSLILFAHTDTEPYNPVPSWRNDPFKPVVCDGRLFGWGVADDLAGVAIQLASLELARDNGVLFDGELILIAAPSKRHARGISAALHDGLQADAAIYLHPAESGCGLAEIKAFAPGQLEFRINVEGKPPETREPNHTAFAHRGINPFLLATRIVSQLEQYDLARGNRIQHPVLQSAIGRSTNLMLYQCAYGALDRVPQIGHNFTMAGSISLIPGEKLENVMAEIESVVAAVAVGPEWRSTRRPRIEWVSGVSGAETAQHSDIYQCVWLAIRHAGTTAAVNPLHTSSDIRNPIVQKGIPTVGYGPLCGNLSMAGLTDEWVDVADFRRSVEVTTDIISRWCSGI